MSRGKHDFPGSQLAIGNWMSAMSTLMNSRRFVAALVAAGFTLIFMLVSHQAAALEYRKCNLKVMIKGSGLPTVEVQGARFWSWARRRFASQSWDAINNRAGACAWAMAPRDLDTLPDVCRTRAATLNNSSALGSGISGLGTSHMHSLIEKTICENHTRANPNVRTIQDTRKIDGFAVWVQPVGTSQACRSTPIIPPSFLTIHCRKNGDDQDFEWSYKGN